MADNQSVESEIENILDRLAVRMYDEGQLDKPSLMGRQVAIVNISEAKAMLTDLINSAKREAQIKMLKNMKGSLMVARLNPGLNPLQLPEDARTQQIIADEFDRNIAQLEQSKESK